MTTTATHALSIRYAAETLFENKQRYEVRRSAFETIVALAGELAAENKALEERVRALWVAIKSVLPGSQVTAEAHAWLASAIAADDAKAAGEPEPDTSMRYDAALRVLHEHRHRVQDSRSGDERSRLEPGLLYAIDALELREAALPNPARAERYKQAIEELGPPTDDRASRRRAFVRETCSRVIGVLTLASLSDVDRARIRAKAIEQAGLIFDETEQSGE